MTTQDDIDTLPSSITPGVTADHIAHSKTYKLIFQALLDAIGVIDAVTATPVVVTGTGDHLSQIQDALDAAAAADGGAVRLYGPATVSDEVQVPNKCVLELGPRSEQTSLTARSGFGSDTLVRLGATGDSFAFGSQVRGGILDCAGHADIAVGSTKAQEQSGVFGSVLTNWAVHGVNWDGAGNANVSLEDLETYPRSSGATSAVLFNGTGGANYVKRLTMGVQGPLSESCLHIRNATVFGGALHCENALYGIDLDEDAAASLHGVTAGAGTANVTALVRLRSNGRYAMVGGINKYAATHTIQDDFAGITHDDPLIPLWVGGVALMTQLQLLTLQHVGSALGFYNTTPTGKPTVSGSRGGNAALASLCTALANLGLITDSTS